MTLVRKYGFMFLSVIFMIVLVSVPVVGSEHGESLTEINWLDMIATLIEWMAILFETAAQSLRDSLNYFVDIMGENGGESPQNTTS